MRNAYLKNSLLKNMCYAFVMTLVVSTLPNCSPKEKMSSSVSDSMEQTTATVTQQVPETKDENKLLSEREIEQYAGIYTLEANGRTMEVRVFGENGLLKAHPQGQIVGVLLPDGDHAFTYAEDSNIKVVFNVENGKANTLTLHQRGMEVVGKRKL